MHDDSDSRINYAHIEDTEVPNHAGLRYPNYLFRFVSFRFDFNFKFYANNIFISFLIYFPLLLKMTSNKDHEYFYGSYVIFVDVIVFNHG